MVLVVVVAFVVVSGCRGVSGNVSTTRIILVIIVWKILNVSEYSSPKP